MSPEVEMLYNWLGSLVVHLQELARMHLILCEAEINNINKLTKQQAAQLVQWYDKVNVKRYKRRNGQTRVNETEKCILTACIVRHVEANGYTSEVPAIDLSSSKTSTHARTEFAKEARLYPPSNAITIFPSAKSISWQK